MTKVPSMNLPGISADDSLMLLRAATELSFSSILVTDAQHRILYANPAFCATTGYSPDELEGQNPRILQGPLTDKSVIEKLHYDRDTGIPQCEHNGCDPLPVLSSLAPVF